MITYQDCPNCGTRKIHSTVRLCEVCETWERAEEALNAQDEVLTAKYNQQLARAEKAEKERDELRAEVERLQSWTPIGTYSLDVQHEEERLRITKERDLARAEGSRLREALAKISLDEYESTSSATEKVHGHARIAREALRGASTSDTKEES